MNNIGGPPELFYSFQSSLAEKYGAFNIIVIPILSLILENKFAFEKIFIVQKVHLEPGIRQACNLDL